MSQIAKMIINDPESFHLLTTDAKERIIKAATNTVNIQAALAKKQNVKTMKGTFTLRKTFTTRKVQYDQMPKGRYALHAIHSTIGVTEKAAYMERQEKGGIHKPATGSTLAIPTDIARSGNRARPVGRIYRLNKVKVQKVRGAFKKNIASKKPGKLHGLILHLKPANYYLMAEICIKLSALKQKTETYRSD